MFKLIKELLLVLIGFAIIYFFVNAWVKTQVKAPNPNNKSEDYSYSEGVCKSDNDCHYAGDSCGGGHGYCTNNPGKYKGVITTCEINQKHPINNHFSCICQAGKCGWVK